MEKSFTRSLRVAPELQRNISIIIHFHLKDPRIKTTVTVSEVKVSKDLSYAQVFVSFLEENNVNVKKILIILNKASGYIRKLLCKKMRLRIIPNIVFYYDDAYLKGNKISLLLNKILN